NGDRRHHDVELEYLAAVLDEVAEPEVGGLELADHHADERQPGIYFEGGDQGRHATGQHHLGEDLALGRPEGLGELGLVRVDARKAVVDHENRDEQRDRERHRIDRQGGAEPDVEDRYERGLRHRIGDHQIRVEHLVEVIPPPQRRRYDNAEHHGGRESDYGGYHGGPGGGRDTGLLRRVPDEVEEGRPQRRRIAGEQRVDDLRPRQNLPQHQEHRQQRDLGGAHREAAAPFAPQPVAILRRGDRNG